MRSKVDSMIIVYTFHCNILWISLLINLIITFGNSTKIFVFMTVQKRVYPGHGRFLNTLFLNRQAESIPEFLSLN